MVLIKNKKKKNLIVLRIAVLAVLAYVLFILINNQIQLNEKRQELESLKEQVNIQELKNENLRSITDASDKNEYLKGVARSKLDFIEQGGRVFVNVSGD